MSKFFQFLSKGLQIPNRKGVVVFFGTIHILAVTAMIVSGNKPKNLFYVAFLAFLSHFILDFLPHYGYMGDYFLAVIIDGLFMALLSVYFLRNFHQKAMILVGVFFSVLPDINTFFVKIGYNFFPSLHKFHVDIQVNQVYSYLGFGIEVLAALVLLAIIFRPGYLGKAVFEGAS